MMTLAGAPGFGTPLIAQLLGFLIVAALIWKFGVPFIRKMVGGRTTSIAGEFDKLEREVQESSRALADLKKKLANLDGESQMRIAKALEEGAYMKTQAVSEATQQAAAELAKAKRDIQIERDKAILELRIEVVRRTIEVTERAVEGLVDEPIHGRMVDKYLGQLDKAAR